MLSASKLEDSAKFLQVDLQVDCGISKICIGKYSQDLSPAVYAQPWKCNALFRNSVQ